MSFARIQTAIQPLRQALLNHPVYEQLRTADALRTFMQHHAFAVWDFMSLLKSLQRDLCCVTVPWLPTPHSAATRMINEIVLGEESDEDGRGGYSSHFDLYRRAMRAFGADTSQLDRLIGVLCGGGSLSAALDASQVPDSVRQFVEQTFRIIDSGDACQVASAFTFGREDLLPDVFRRVVSEIQLRSGNALDDFQFYLERHIELDHDEHGPMAVELMSSLCGDDPERWRRAHAAAMASLESRLILWDGIHGEIARHLSV